MEKDRFQWSNHMNTDTLTSVGHLIHVSMLTVTPITISVPYAINLGYLWLNPYSKTSMKEGDKGQKTSGDDIITWCLLIDIGVKSVE